MVRKSFYFAATVVAITYTSGYFVQVSRGQLSLVLSQKIVPNK